MAVSLPKMRTCSKPLTISVSKMVGKQPLKTLWHAEEIAALILWLHRNARDPFSLETSSPTLQQHCREFNYWAQADPARSVFDELLCSKRPFCPVQNSVLLF